MNEDKKVHIIIFQAPAASLMERDLYLKMNDLNHTFCETVPAEYYLIVFDGEIECPQQFPEEEEQRVHMILQHVCTIFNTAHPAGYCGRSLSVGDVVMLEGKYYLCVPKGFREVTFEISLNRPTANPTACPLRLPDGTALQVAVYSERETWHPRISIDLVAADGMREQVCFVVYNPDKEPGRELCIGVYRANSDETVYYDSYYETEKVRAES